MFWGGGEGIGETPSLGQFLSHLTEHWLLCYGEDTNYVNTDFIAVAYCLLVDE